jgi:ribonuclease HI
LPDLRVLRVHTDGGSRGNPGAAAYGFIFLSESGEVLYEGGKFLGTATNNEAEYSGLLAALETLVGFQNLDELQEIQIRLDSNLVVQQVLGNWKIKEARLLPLVQQIRGLLAKLPCKYTIQHVPRAENSLADAKVNQILDAETFQ